jgi:hypothetical protein
MWSVISVGLALLINFYSPEIPKNKKWIKSDCEKNIIITGFPYEYFKGEILTDEMLKFRIRLIYIPLMIYITVIFSTGSIVSPILLQTSLFSTTTSIENLVPNQLNSETNQQEFLINLRGGENSNLSEIIIRILLVWTMGNNFKSTDAFQGKMNPPNFVNQAQPIGRHRFVPRPRWQENEMNPGHEICRPRKNVLSLDQLANSLSSEYEQFQSKYVSESLL